MIVEFVNQWYKNKDNLEAALKKEKDFGLEYVDLVSMLIREVINPGQTKWDYILDLENLQELDHGEYQGTKIFIIPVRTYQPDTGDYFFTHNFYGSCSGCDTLLSIWDWDSDGTLKEGQVDKLMSLCLHLLQNFKPLIQKCEPKEEINVKDLL